MLTTKGTKDTKRRRGPMLTTKSTKDTKNRSGNRTPFNLFFVLFVFFALKNHHSTILLIPSVILLTLKLSRRPTLFPVSFK